MSAFCVGFGNALNNDYEILSKKYNVLWQNFVEIANDLQSYNYAQRIE